jgi:uncharacterized protein YndB with AHSA1/START domain
MNEQQNYTITISVDAPPETVFAAINNPRGWWSESTEGLTDKLGAIFYYHYKDIHRCTVQITELVPNKKVVWHVLKNYFNFVKDSAEWTGNDVVFEIEPKGDKTEVRFTQVGLVPDYECYDVCASAWSGYIRASLPNLITKGKGQPNPKEDVVTSPNDYKTSITVDASPSDVFSAALNVRDWWSANIDGDTDKLGSIFTFHHKDLHRTTHQITEFVPERRVVWHTTESNINFVKDKNEWLHTDVVFDIKPQGNKTELTFTHIGLVPAGECYDACSTAWSFYVNESLRDLIATGKGQPEEKD